MHREVNRCAAMDVRGWLWRLGLEQYEAAFRENEIDDTILPRLTAEDLKDLGVVAVGHRRKLLDAIAALRAEAGAPTSLSDAPLATDKAANDTAERRQVTVMFADLVGSTALSARMDPEDLREIISAYQRCVAETVRRFGGFVARYLGDGVLIYFGYPQAHEDDAERAVRAGLALINAVSTLPAPALTRHRQYRVLAEVARPTPLLKDRPIGQAPCQGLLPLWPGLPCNPRSNHGRCSDRTNRSCTHICR
jgi:hypothetical protein